MGTGEVGDVVGMRWAWLAWDPHLSAWIVQPKRGAYAAAERRRRALKGAR